jgi:type II secretory pathway pseudopilin PulG
MGILTMIKRLRSGFTIIELMLYMGIFSVLVAVLGNIFLSIMDQQLNTQSNTEVTQNINYIFARLSYDTYAASSLSVPNSQTLILNVNNTYSLSGSNLILTNPSGTFVLNTPDVSVTNFTVTPLASNTNVHIGITVTSNITPLGKSPQTVSLSNSYTLR